MGMRTLLGVIAILLAFQNVSAETVTDSNITIGIDIPEYVSQNETFSMNFSAVNISAYPFAFGFIYLDGSLLKSPTISFFWSNIWNMTVKRNFSGGVGGIEWNLPSDAQYFAGQTIPLKFRAQEVAHTVEFFVIYCIPDPSSHTCLSKVISAEDNMTAIPVFDPSVSVTVSSASVTVFEAISGKGVDYVRFSDGNQQYIVNWDSSGNPPGEYIMRSSFSNGFMNETKILLQ